MKTFLFLFVMASAVAQGALPPADFADISYGTHERHKLDLWQAKSDTPMPLLIFVHGDGWAGGNKTDLPMKVLKAMLDKGISVASMNYRFTSMAIMPAPWHDAAPAVQFLRGKAVEWRLDPQRFGGYGISAGACTVLWLACHEDLAKSDDSDALARLSTRLQVVVGLSPPTILEPEQMIQWVGDKVMEHPVIPRAVGAKSWEEVRQHPEKWRDLLLECSVLPHLNADDAPIMLGFPTRYQPKHSQVEPVLMTSRDGVNFKRWEEPLIPITAPKDRDWNRSNYMANGVLQLPGHERELSVYATEAYYQGPGSRLRRFTFRVDGFVSASADKGEVITKPMIFTGSQLFLNIVSKGATRVEIQYANGNAIPGFTLADCTPITGDHTDHIVNWKGGIPAAHAGKPVKLRFVLHQADLFALQFIP